MHGIGGAYTNGNEARRRAYDNIRWWNGDDEIILLVHTAHTHNHRTQHTHSLTQPCGVRRTSSRYPTKKATHLIIKWSIDGFWNVVESIERARAHSTHTVYSFRWKTRKIQSSCAAGDSHCVQTLWAHSSFSFFLCWSWSWHYMPLFWPVSFKSNQLILFHCVKNGRIHNWIDCVSVKRITIFFIIMPRHAMPW